MPFVSLLVMQRVLFSAAHNITENVGVGPKSQRSRSMRVTATIPAKEISTRSVVVMELVPEQAEATSRYSRILAVSMATPPLLDHRLLLLPQPLLLLVDHSSTQVLADTLALDATPNQPLAVLYQMERLLQARLSHFVSLLARLATTSMLVWSMVVSVGAVMLSQLARSLQLSRTVTWFAVVMPLNTVVRVAD